MATLVRGLHAGVILLWLWVRGGDGYSCPYGQHCFEPAPPGRAPNCALPGLTYCIHPDTYPDHIIRELIRGGRYDSRTLLSDESEEDFSATIWRPPPKYGPPDYPYSYGPSSLPNVEQVSLVEEPIHIPKPGYRFQNSFNNKDFFSQKTPLQPPTALDQYSPANLPNFKLANYSAFNNFRGLNTGTSNIWGQPSNPQGHVLSYEAAHYKKYSQSSRQNSFLPSPNDYYKVPQNQYNRHDYRPGHEPHAGGWVRHSVAGVTPYNPVEWWRYVNPNSRSDVTIESSISLPPSSSVFYPQNLTTHALRKRRRRSAPGPVLPAGDLRKLTGAQALKMALRRARSELEAEHVRTKRQAPGNIVQLCQTRSQYITPRAALNNQGNWRYVVNMAENMTQLVRAEICTSNECNNICSVPLGYASRCEQKYVQKRLVALQSNGQNLYTDVFWIPSCCQCAIVNNNGNSLN